LEFAKGFKETVYLGKAFNLGVITVQEDVAAAWKHHDTGIRGRPAIKFDACFPIKEIVGISLQNEYRFFDPRVPKAGAPAAERPDPGQWNLVQRDVAVLPGYDRRQLPGRESSRNLRVRS